MDTPTAFAQPCPKSPILCLSHLRWDLVFQRLQHLMTRAAGEHDVIYFEEPLREAAKWPSLRIRAERSGVRVATPVLPIDCQDVNAALKSLVDGLVRKTPHEQIVVWYYTPMALDFAGHLAADVTVYGCMDELSAFRDPPPGLQANEARLFRRADVVFTGGMSLYVAKRDKHPQVFAFPSSVDAAHFGRARGPLADPEDQRGIGHPRVGFFGVIDERMDLTLVCEVAARLPGVQFVMLGPVVKIDAAALPRLANLHWLGAKAYAQLPNYMANWDACWMPFALNDSTRFISLTKTPEFLAAGLSLMLTPVPAWCAAMARGGWSPSPRGGCGDGCGRAVAGETRACVAGFGRPASGDDELGCDMGGDADRACAGGAKEAGASAAGVDAGLGAGGFGCITGSSWGRALRGR